MTERPLHEVLCELAEQVAAIDEEDVIDSAASIVTIYKRERLIALDMAAVDSMVSDGPEEIDESDARLIRVRENLRDRLRALLAWARAAKRT